MQFHRGYAVLALAVFAIEVVIALYVRDRFVRPYLGDVLAVILVYLGLRTLTRLRVTAAAICALAIAFLVEFGQLFGFVDRIGLSQNRVARIVFGTGFDLHDLLAYAAGALIVVAIERSWPGRRR